MKKKRPAASDGLTYMHQMERRLHQMLHYMAFTSRVGVASQASTGQSDKKERICVAGWDDPTVRWMARVLQSGPYHTDQDCIDTVMLNDDVTAASFTDAKYVLLCLEISSIDESNDHLNRLHHLFQAIRYTHSANVRICCALVGAEDGYKGFLHKIYASFPEIRWLVHRHHLTMVNLSTNLTDGRLDGYTREGLRNWLVHKSATVQESDDVLDYTDILKIVQRESKRHLPELVTFFRLILMCIVGCIWVLLTVIALVAITGEAGLQRDVQTATDSLAARIARQRTGKAEWGWRTNAAALTALQLYHSSWCFDSLENQRSVDRMEIGLLAAISRSRDVISREITLVQLASHVTSLLATYQNPRDFYGHDLVTSIEEYVIHQVPFLPANHYAHSLAILALYNAGVQIERRHVERLLASQKADGSYTYGPGSVFPVSCCTQGLCREGNDSVRRALGHLKLIISFADTARLLYLYLHGNENECAIVAMALTCGSQDPEIELGMRRAVNFLVSQRRSDGSYGNVHATALTVQALNATNTHLGIREQEKTIKWLVARIEREPSLRSLDVASNVLIAISGKTLLGVRYFTARLPEKNAVALRNPLPIFLKVDDDDEEEGAKETEDSSAPEVKDDSEILLEDHADTRLRNASSTREVDMSTDTQNNDDADAAPDTAGQATDDTLQQDETAESIL